MESSYLRPALISLFRSDLGTLVLSRHLFVCTLNSSASFCGNCVALSSSAVMTSTTGSDLGVTEKLRQEPARSSLQVTEDVC